MSRWGWKARKNGRRHRRGILRARLLRSRLRKHNAPRRTSSCPPCPLHLKTPFTAVEAVDAIEDVGAGGGGRP